jgi:hypothetical protein
MSASDAGKVFNKLEKMGLLGKFAQEVMQSLGFKRGGMSASDRGALFATLARKIDEASMAALTESFANRATSFGQAIDYLSEITNAVATHGSFTQKFDFLNAIAGSKEA